MLLSWLDMPSAVLEGLPLWCGTILQEVNQRQRDVCCEEAL